MADGSAPESETEVREFFDRWIGCANGGDWAGFYEAQRPDGR